MMNVAFTIVTPDYLGFARALVSSFLDKNSDYLFIVCLLGKVDSVDADMWQNANVQMLELNELEIPEIHEMRGRYNQFELSCALKPFVSLQLIERYFPEVLIYLDSDILVFGDFLELEKFKDSHAFALTPHCLSPDDRLDSHAMDLKLLNYGLYNAGFFSVFPKHRSAVDILRWWSDKMKTECFTDLVNGRYVDQIWLNLIPIYFQSVVVIRHLGYNVAVWNLYERCIDYSAGIFTVNGQADLIFYHFSGFSPMNPTVPSQKHSYFSFSSRKDITPVYDLYIQKLKIAEFTKYRISKEALDDKDEIIGVGLTKSLIRRIRGLYKN